MPNIPPRTIDQPRSEEDQNAALDEESASEMVPQNESLYSKLVSSLGGIVWEADGKTFQFTFVSPQAEHILGYPVEQWFNEPDFWRKHTHPDDADWCAAYCLDATTQHRDHEFKYRMIAADGRVVWLQDIVSVKIEADESVRLRGIMIDITERMRADEALAESETRFRTTFENSGSGMALVDMQGHPVESNPALQKLLGYTAKELSSMAFTEFTHVDDRKLDWGLYNELVAGKRDRYEIEKRFVTKEGRIVCGNLIVSLVRDTEGTPKYAVGMVQDITTRKQAEDELRRTSERLQLATRAAGIGIWDWDVVKDELIWDDAMYRLSGIRKEDFSGAYDAWATSLAPEDFEWVSAEVQAALRGEREFAAEFRIVRSDGSVRFIKAASQTFRDEEGRPLRMVGINYDFTKRKRAEEELRQSQERFFRTFHASPVAVVLARLEDGRLIEVNEAAQRFFGFSREEMIGRTTVELGVWAKPDDRRSRVEELIRLGSVREREYEFRTRQGEVLVGLYSSELMEIDGVKCIQTVVQDITERKEVEEQLKTSSRQLRALSESLRKAKEDEGIRIAREIHDELGSALTSLKWSLLRLDKVYSGEGNPAAQAGALEEIDGMVGLVDTTINTVRRIASELRPGVLDDLGLIPAIEWHAQQFQEHTGVVCRFDSLIENVELNRDQATAVFRIFQEAMTNILRHARATKVNIIIEEEESEFVLEIKDNGRGISESERLGIHSLGLLGMRERAHSIGGKVEINGSAGKGTVLTVRLPIRGDTTF